MPTQAAPMGMGGSALLHACKSCIDQWKRLFGERSDDHVGSDGLALVLASSSTNSSELHKMWVGGKSGPTTMTTTAGSSVSSLFSP